MGKHRVEASMSRLVKLLERAEQPFNADAIEMDCNDGCEQISKLAERVAAGEDLETLFPEFSDHMDQIGCCKEEFDALVSVIAAEAEIMAELEAFENKLENETQADTEE